MCFNPGFACVYTAELLPRHGRPSFVRPLTQVIRKPLYGSRPNFRGNYVSTMSPDKFFFLFFFQKFSFFIMIFFSRNAKPYGSQNFKTLLLPQNWSRIVFKLLLTFCLLYPHKVAYQFFFIFEC